MTFLSNFRWWIPPLSMCLFSVSLNAQQLPVWSQLSDVQDMTNPANLSSDYLRTGQRCEITATVRKQWLNLPSSPTTCVLRGSYLTKQKEAAHSRFLFGGSILKDVNGALNFQYLQGRVAVVLSKRQADPFDWHFVGGLNMGFRQQFLDASKITFIQPPDVINPETFKVTSRVLGGGVYISKGFQENNILYGSLSIQQPLPNFSKHLEGIAWSLPRVPHYYGSFGAQIKPKDFFPFIEPSISFGYVPNGVFQTTWHCRFVKTHAVIEQCIFWLGGGVTSTGFLEAESMKAEGGAYFVYNKTAIKIGYGINIPLSITSAFGTTHEMTVAFLFLEKK